MTKVVPRAPGDELYTDEEWQALTNDVLPTGERLVAIRRELLELCAAHAPAEVPECTMLLMWAELDLVFQCPCIG